MPLPPGAPFAPNDDFLGPIITQIASVISTNITGVGQVYTEEPDGAPENNSCLITFMKMKMVDDTNYKIKVRLTFELRHIVRRTRMKDSVKQARTYLFPYLQAFSAVENQTLNGLSILVEPVEQTIIQWIHSGEPRSACRTAIDVLTEFNIV